MLVVQQKRKFFDEFPRLKSTVRGDRTLWNSLPDGLRRLVTKQKLQVRNNCTKNVIGCESNRLTMLRTAHQVAVQLRQWKETKRIVQTGTGINYGAKDERLTKF